MGVAGGRVPGVASWGPLWHFVAARADLHENLWGHADSSGFVRSAVAPPPLGLSLQRCGWFASGLPPLKNKTGVTTLEYAGVSWSYYIIGIGLIKDFAAD